MKLSTLWTRIRIGGFCGKRLTRRPGPVALDREGEVRALLARPPFGITDLTETTLPLYDRALTHRSYANQGEYPAVTFEDTFTASTTSRRVR